MSTDVMRGRESEARALDTRYVSDRVARELRAPWRDMAACQGLGDLMDDPSMERQAKQVCHRCPVQQACTNWVLGLDWKRDPGGVVAGRNEEERTKERQSWSAKSRNAQTALTPAEVPA